MILSHDFLSLDARYPLLQTHAERSVLAFPATVPLLDGQAVHLLPDVLPSPYRLDPHEHLWLPGPVCVQMWPSPAQSSSSLEHGSYCLHE